MVALKLRTGGSTRAGILIVSCIPAIVSGGRGAFLIRAAIFLIMTFEGDKQLKLQKRTILVCVFVFIIGVITIIVGSWLRSGTRIDISDYLFKRITGYVDGISVIRLNLISDAFNGLNIKSYFLNLLHISNEKAGVIYTRELSQPVIYSNGVPYVYVDGKWIISSKIGRFDTNLHGQAMPGFSAAFCYGSYLGVFVYGFIIGIVLNLIETVKGRTVSQIIHFVLSYIYIGVLLIVLDGNIEGVIEIIVPMVGCILLEGMERWTNKNEKMEDV